jgi:glutamyl-tRNA(Gln) amidotransferase subunit E
MDDTPPFAINQVALDYAVEIAVMLNCKLVDEVHITRKQYLDGSIPTGFQRTAIIGVDGWIPYRGRRIDIQQLALEEDACREVDDKGHTVVFRTDRLSTPLVEVVTKPDMRTPHEAAEVDGLLGRLLRASGRVRRGIGSARQDVNVSITGSDRVEIKGVPRTPDIRALTHYEALRHKALLELRAELARRGVTAATFQSRERDVTGLMSKTRNERLRKVREEGGRLRAVLLAGWGDAPAWKTQPGLTFADELAGRVRVIACLDDMPNLFVLDGRGVGLSVPEEAHVRKALGAKENDAVLLVWGPDEDAQTAVNEILDRAREALGGVPQETRQHMPDACRTDFERILPGPDRMYPDTDSPPVPLARERLAAIFAQQARRPWEREETYVGKGVPACTARQLAIHRHARLFDRLLADPPLTALAVAVALADWDKAIRRTLRRTGKVLPLPAVPALETFLRLAGERRTPARALRLGLAQLYETGAAEPPPPLPEAELTALCGRVFAEAGAVWWRTRAKTVDRLLGLVVERSGGRADPAAARGMLERLVPAAPPVSAAAPAAC